MGIDSIESNTANSATNEHVLMLSARYPAGISLRNARDRTELNACIQQVGVVESCPQW